jgi:pimeloyl-ACP methyl ester carboxylesterase
MAHDAIAFIEAMDLQRVDLLGFSIGSFVAQEIALIRPDLLRRVVLASSAPQGAAGMHGWAPEVIGAVGEPETSPEGYLSVFFAPPTRVARRASRPPGASSGGRRPRRADDVADPPGAVRRRVRVGHPNHSLLERVAAIELPVFVANGDSDPMILPRYSHLTGGVLPNARVTIYPRFGPRLPLPAPHPVRRGRARLPLGLTAAQPVHPEPAPVLAAGMWPT